MIRTLTPPTARHRGRSRLSVVLALLLQGLLPLAIHPASAEDTATPPPTDSAPAYWHSQRDGWFWYREPPVKPAKPEKPDTRPPELPAFEQMQARLETLKRIAVMNPTEQNLATYMHYQRFVMEKSQTFADRWQRLVWTTPALDYALGGRPTNAMAIGVFDDEQRRKHEDRVRALAASHGLIFVFRSDCPYCHRFAPILKRFEETYGMTVVPVSLDGSGLPAYPNPRRNDGLAARLQPEAVPALYLAAPSRREIRPVGFGLMALSELVERIATLDEAHAR
jgi:conjugal transfer pilus assembly protein TraF